MKKFFTMACALVCAVAAFTACDEDDAFNWKSIIPSLKATVGDFSYDHKAFFYEKSDASSAPAFVKNILDGIIPSEGTAVVGTSTDPYLIVAFGGQEGGEYTEDTNFKPMEVLNNGLTNGDWSLGVNIGALVFYHNGETTDKASYYVSTDANVSVSKSQNALGVNYYDGSFTATLVNINNDTIIVNNGSFKSVYGKSESKNLGEE